MIDAHCHLQLSAFSEDLEEVIKKANKKGVDIIINSSIDIESSKNAVRLAEKYENFYAIIGIHPHNADSLNASWEKELVEIAKSSKKVVGIGEIGLDYYKHGSEEIVDPEIQKKVFIAQIKFANDLGLPLQIHNRQAGDDILKILKENKEKLLDPPGMFHCMSGNVPFLKEVLDLGFYIGFDGNITYDGIAKGEDTPLPELVKNTPIEKIVTETDAPYLTPIPYRGSRNEPVHVIIVGGEIAKIKGINEKEVEEITARNIKKLFNLK